MLLTPADRQAIVRDMPEALAYVSSRLAPSDRDTRTTAIGRIASMPAQGVADGFGKAVIEAYHIALDDVPADLLNTAVERCLKDGKRTFRPSPPELRGYIADDLQARQRAKRRLNAIRDRHCKKTPDPEPERPFDTAAVMAKCFADLDAGYQRMEGRPMPGRKPTMAPVPANVSTALRMPTQAELQEIADLLDRQPRRERMTLTDADRAALGVG